MHVATFSTILRRTSLFSAAILQSAAFSLGPSSQQNNAVDSRRDFLSNAFIKVPSAAAVAGSVILNNPLQANAAVSTSELVGDLETSLNKMVVIPELLDQQEWDKGKFCEIDNHTYSKLSNSFKAPSLNDI